MDAPKLDTWKRIPRGQLPCVSCGIAVSGAVLVETLTIYGDSRRPDVSPPSHDLPVTRCETCQSIQEAARALMLGHPGVKARIGSLDIGVHRLECALNALDALGFDDPSVIDRLTNSGADLVRLMDALTTPGGIARWGVHARSGGYLDGPSTPASLVRWQHLTAEHRQTLRTAAAALLAHRVERPVSVLAPSDDGSLTGCMLCGVGAVIAPRADAESAWVLSSADSVTIGGRPLPDTLDGVVCGVCDDAIDAARGVGRSAMTLSVRAFLKVPRHLRSFESIEGLVGWAALPAGATPNVQPWDHVDLREVRESVNALLGYRPE